MPTKWKSEKVNSLIAKLNKKTVTGIASVKNIPSFQMQMIRKMLRNKIDIEVIKNTLLSIAVKEAAKNKPGLEKIINYLEEQTAVVTSNLNSFKVFQELENTKTPAPAKGGETAPADIVVKAGDTPFKPGPFVGELQKAGIPAAIQSGKVVIKKDTTLVKKGEKISKEIAQILKKLEIYPLTIGLDLKATYEDGILFLREALKINKSEIIENIQTCVRNSFTIAYKINYITPLTIKPLLQDAYRKAFGIAITTNTFVKETIEYFLRKAYIQTINLCVKAHYLATEMPLLGGEYMEYIYSAMLLHSLKKPITEESIANILRAVGVEPDMARIKALTTALEGINIKEVLESSIPLFGAPQVSLGQPAQAGPTSPEMPKGEEKKKEEKKEEKKVSEEEAAAGLSALFGEE